MELTSKNIREIFEKYPEQFKDCYIIEAEDGYDFQDYVYIDGKKVTAGTPIGYENERGVLTLLNDIYFNS